jgi:hypothetical protein
MDLLRKEIRNGEFAQNQRIRSHTLSVSFRALDLCRHHAVRTNSTRHKYRGVAPHSADTETSRRQFPYHPVQDQIYVMVFSTSKRAMEMDYFLKKFNYWFQIWDFRVYVSVIKCLFSFDAGHLYTQWSLKAQN